MADPQLVGVGASAGGIEALIEMVASLEADLAAVVLVVLHQSAATPTVLPEILARHCPLEVVPARSGDVLRPGRVHVSTPDHHLLAANGRVLLTREPTGNGHRPGVDPLFRSLALDGGPRATGVILSGLLDDGADGLLDIVRYGGTAVVQDPTQARHQGMPRAALARVPGALVRPASGIGAALREIAQRVPPGEHRPSVRRRDEVVAHRVATPATSRRDPSGSWSGPSCPDCGGPMFRVGAGALRCHRCRAGQAPPPGDTDVVRDDVVGWALHAAVRALEDKAALQCRVAGTARESGAQSVEGHALATMRAALGDAAVLRRLLADRSLPIGPAPSGTIRASGSGGARSEPTDEDGSAR